MLNGYNFKRISFKPNERVSGSAAGCIDFATSVYNSGIRNRRETFHVFSRGYLVYVLKTLRKRYIVVIFPLR